MNFREPIYIVAIAEHGDFTRAAEAVSVSRPALSSQGKKVERGLGVPIFERSSRGIVPTEFGARAVGAARQVNASGEASVRWPRTTEGRRRSRRASA